MGIEEIVISHTGWLVWEVPGKCDTEKSIEVYRYREKTIDIAREFDKISIPDIVSKRFRYDIDRSIIISNCIENYRKLSIETIVLSKTIDRNDSYIEIL